jgi:hypothetical protein
MKQEYPGQRRRPLSLTPEILAMLDASARTNLTSPPSKPILDTCGLTLLITALNSPCVCEGRVRSADRHAERCPDAPIDRWWIRFARDRVVLRDRDQRVAG